MNYLQPVQILALLSLLLPGSALAHHHAETEMESPTHSQDDDWQEEGEDDSESPRAKRDDPKEEEKAIEVPKRKKRGIVKVIQKKFFLKYRRLEVTPHVGYIGNDNFIRRFAVGASVGYHINDLLSVETTLSYLPDLKETDYKALTNQFKDGSEVVPDISKVIFLGVINAALSPIYGKVELGNLRIINYDLYFTAGIGVMLLLGRRWGRKPSATPPAGKGDAT